MLPTLPAPPQIRTPCFSSAVYRVSNGIPILVHPANAATVARGSTAPFLEEIL
ncbi:hypothetical protein BDV12DRAFT_181277 [Aspergillus spectabilis]